ncbi:MAG TPA: hypothetical protein VKY57_12335 [Chitinispirillaceae bacterium]|nr:hypothetical protein [Chitinispirillaceae bacterium]
MKNIFILLCLTFYSLSTCETNNNDYSEPVEIGNEYTIDTNQSFTGKINSFSGENSIHVHQYLSVINELNDTMNFSVNPSKTENYDLNKLKPGNTIKIFYLIYITEINKIEVSRIYFAKKLEYLDEKIKN